MPKSDDVMNASMSLDDGIITHQDTYAVQFGHRSIAALGDDTTVQFAWCVAHTCVLALSETTTGQERSLGRT